MLIPDYFVFRKVISVFEVFHNSTPKYMIIFKYMHKHEISSERTRLKFYKKY